MRVSSIGLLTGFSTLILLFLLASVHTEAVEDNSCPVVLTEECELRWSRRKQAFVTSSNGNGLMFTGKLSSTSTEHGEGEIGEFNNNKMICIRAPDNHHVVLHFFADSFGKKITPQTTDCNAAFPSECKAACLVIHGTKQSVTAGSRSGRVKDSVTDSTTATSFASAHNYFNENDKVAESRPNAERFPRHSLASVTNENRKPGHYSVKVNGKGYKEHQRKKKFGERRRKHRGHRRKLEIIKLLLKYYHKLLIKRRSNMHVLGERAVNRTSIPGKFRISSVRGSTLQAVRDRIDHFVNSARRRRRRLPIKSTLRDLGGNGLMVTRSAETDTSAFSIVPAENYPAGRDKRQAETSSRTSRSTIGGNSALRIALCGLRTAENTSMADVMHGNSTIFRKVLRHRSDLKGICNSTSEWVSPKTQLSVRSVDTKMSMKIAGEVGINDDLLQRLLVKISFEAGTGNRQMKEADGVPADENVQLTSSRVYDFENRTLIDLYTYIENQDGRDGGNNALNIAMGGAIGSLPIVLFVGIFMFILWRRRRRRRSSYKSRQNQPIDKAEREKCLSGVESCPTSRTWCLKRGKKSYHLTEVLEEKGKFKMLEHENVERTPVPGTKHHQKRQVSECKHVHATRGSSRHVHCIVCQIAEKPHRPIMNAQYASDFLPPASRYNDTGCDETFPNSQGNFGKFNRMQNNPFRHSPRLSSKNPPLPWSVKLPDGEELYRNRQAPKKYNEITTSSGNTICVRPPPNRTIFRSEALPFNRGDLHHKGRATDNPGPPTSVSNTVVEHAGDECSNLNGITRNASYSGTGANHGDNCICRFIIRRIDEPPPEYSDVIRNEPVDHENAHRNRRTAADAHSGTTILRTLGSSQKNNESNSSCGT